MTLSVVGAGLGRTGTSSLKLALEQLGLGRCYHMVEVLENPEAAPLWLEAAHGRPDWERIFAGYGATVDYPGCRFWRELSAYYPDAKVLLSVRDPEAWYESARATIFSDFWLERCRSSPMAEFFNETVFRDFGYGDRLGDRDFMIDYFRRHTEEVKAAIPPERLLVYDAAEGWAPLCAFLDVEAPATPFPRANTREEMLGRIQGVDHPLSGHG